MGLCDAFTFVSLVNNTNTIAVLLSWKKPALLKASSSVEEARDRDFQGRKETGQDQVAENNLQKIT